jgi:hypothetical protein
MSLLWTQAARHEAMPWHHDPHTQFDHSVVHPVTKAGFASYTDSSDVVDEHEEMRRDGEGHGGEEHDDFDDNLYDETSPEPTDEERAHHEEHGEWPDDYYERHDAAYLKAKEDKGKPEYPDREDHDLAKFIGEHGSNNELWHGHAELRHVDLTRPVHATQPLVSQTHIDRYKSNPGDVSDHRYSFPEASSDYPGESHPMFVTHHGELHTIEGHHRVAAALAQGKKSIKGWHYDLDKDPGYANEQSQDDWRSPHDWDDDDREYHGLLRDSGRRWHE